MWAGAARVDPVVFKKFQMVQYKRRVSMLLRPECTVQVFTQINAFPALIVQAQDGIMFPLPDAFRVGAHSSW